MTVTKCDICGKTIEPYKCSYQLIYRGLVNRPKDICISCLDRIQAELKEEESEDKQC